MKLGNYINELLYEQNCVIVPELGGFITRRISSQINFTANKISPPGKRVAFNQSLNVNDGLLAKHVSVRENISYEEAVEQIRKYIVELRNALFENRTIQLDEVGTFYLDTDEVMTFHPARDLNVSKENFGLITIAAIPIQRQAEDRLKKRIRAKVENRRPVQNIRKINTSKTNRIYMAVAVVLVFIIAVAPAFTPKGYADFASLNFFKNVDFTLPWNRVNVLPYEPKKMLCPLTKEQIDELKPLSVAVSDSTYFLLAQGFSSVKEAKENVDIFKNAGADAGLSIKENGLTWIYISKLNNREEAEEAAVSVKNIFPDANVKARKK